MADHTQRLAIIVTAQDLASGKLGKVKAELGQLGTSGKLAAVGLGATMKAAATGEKALGHLKGRISGLTNAIGPLVGIGGLLGLTTLLTSSITEASEFGKNVALVAKVTGLAVGTASAMVDTLDKWGVSSDRIIPMLGKLEKNLGMITKTGKSTAAFQKQYGVSLLDNKGRIADANELLLRSADYFNSTATASDKATFMSKLWGKSWQDLIPILSKGSTFIKAQEKDSIHLTDTQLANIAKMRNAQRDFQDAFGDVQVKVGAELMPLLTGAFKSASAWFDSNGDKIAAFFHDAADAAGHAAQSAGEVFSSLKKGWDKIPAPIRDFLVKGFIADRTIHFLFGISPGKLVLSLAGDVIGPAISHGLGGALGGFLQKGGSPANPMFVKDIGGGLGGGGGLPGGLGGAAAGAAGGIGLGTVAALVAIPVALAALGLVIARINDPEGVKNDQGRVSTARARHVPEWNIKEGPALHHDLRNINSSVNAVGGKINDRLTSIHDTVGSVKTTDGRINDHLTDVATNTRRTAAHVHGVGKAVDSAKHAANRTAHHAAIDVSRMRDSIRTAARGTTEAIKDKDLSITTNFNPKIFASISGRDVAAALRTQQLRSKHTIR